MRRALIPLAVAATLIALTGCGRIDGDAVRAEFAGRPGVIEARTTCDQNLPLLFDCYVTVEVERDITVAQLADILPLMRTGLQGARGTIAVESDSPADPDLKIGFAGGGDLAPGVNDTALAQAFVEGIADPRVTTFVLDRLAPGSNGPLARISYQNPELDPDAGKSEDGQNRVAIASMRRVQELIPGASVEVTTADLEIDAPDGSAPEAELELYLAIVSAFPVRDARVEPSLVRIRLPDGTDPGPVQEFAAQHPQYSSIGFVEIASDDSLSASNIDPESAADLSAVIEAARALPQYTSARVEYDRVEFSGTEPETVREIDAALSSLPEYHRIGVRYSGADTTVSRLPGGVLAIDQVIFLAADPSVSEVRITQDASRPEGSHHVDVEGVNNASPYDLGLALARSGVDELPGAWVVVSVRRDVHWAVDFYPDQPLRLETEPWLTSEQAAQFTNGWRDGH